jgi:hypothetical protein
MLWTRLENGEERRGSVQGSEDGKRGRGRLRWEQVYERCRREEGRKDGRKLKRMERVGCCMTHVKWEHQEEQEGICLLILFPVMLNMEKHANPIIKL